MLRTAATRVAESEVLPTSARAVLGYYGDAGVFDWGSLRLKRRVDAATAAMIDDAFAAVEERLADEFGVAEVSFDYDTKLILPAELTLGYHYRHRDQRDHRRAEELTRLAIEALVDGDMRDAINDDEFEDFEVDVPAARADRRRVAEVAQSTLADRVADRFDAYADGVREAYDWAVRVSEGHQDEDAAFRELLAAARSTSADTEDDGRTQQSPAAARERIRDEYKHARFDDPPALFSASERTLPYFKTQYDRVGVIYDGMLEMYDRAGLPVPDAFRKSIVLAIVGAQVWLDDVDDYTADMREGQLTPVTAEYVLTESDREAFESTVDVAEVYLDRAIDHATAAESHLTGIATKYIYYSGSPSVLPGAGD